LELPFLYFVKLRKKLNNNNNNNNNNNKSDNNNGTVITEFSCTGRGK
jgi:hypothetical protein